MRRASTKRYLVNEVSNTYLSIAKIDSTVNVAYIAKVVSTVAVANITCLCPSVPPDWGDPGPRPYFCHC